MKRIILTVAVAALATACNPYDLTNGPEIPNVEQSPDADDICIAGPDGTGTTRWTLSPCQP